MNIFLVIAWGGFLGFAAWIAWNDFRFLRIPVYHALVSACIIIALSFAEKPDIVPIATWLLFHGAGGAFPAALLAFGALKAKNGWGDVLVAFAYGWFVGIAWLGVWLLLSLLPSWIHVAYCFSRKETNPKIPFVTWMTVGLWLWLALRVVVPQFSMRF